MKEKRYLKTETLKFKLRQRWSATAPQCPAHMSLLLLIIIQIPEHHAHNRGYMMFTLPALSSKARLLHTKTFQCGYVL
jgi:hypothetical protein